MGHVDGLARLVGLACTSLWASSCATAPPERDRGHRSVESASEVPLADAVRLEVRPHEATVTVDGIRRFIALGACESHGVRRPLGAGELRALAAAAERLRPHGVETRLANDLTKAQRFAVLDIVTGDDVVNLAAGSRGHCRGYAQHKPPRDPGPPGGPRLTQTSTHTVIKASLAKGEIGVPIQRHLAEFRACYEALLDRGVDAAGKVNLHFVIGPEGRVVRSEVVFNTVHLSMNDCMLSAMQTVEYPKPRGGGIVIITYPFVFATK